MCDSDTDLLQLTQCFDIFLQGHSDQGKQLLLESTLNSKRSIFTSHDCPSLKDNQFTQISNNNIQSLDFQNCFFDNNETIKFEQFLCEQDSIAKLNQHNNNYNHNSEANYKKNKRFLSKHEACRTIFRYYGVDIQVRYQKAEDFEASTLAIFYDKLQQSELQGYLTNPRLLKAVLPKYKPKEPQEESKEKVNYFYCQKYFKNKNYSHLYLIKKLGYKYMPQYSKTKLLQALKHVLQSFLVYKKASTIVFKDFQWLGLEGSLKCIVFFKAIQQIIYEMYTKGQTKLRKVTVCCEKKQSYFQFTTVLRDIGDSYIKNGFYSI